MTANVRSMAAASGCVGVPNDDVSTLMKHGLAPRRRANKYQDTTLGEVCRFEYGTNLPQRDRRPGDVAVFGSNGVVGHHDRAITRGGTIIIGRKGSIGQVALSADACWPIDTTYYIDETLTDCDLTWLALLLRNLRLAELNKATGVPGLNRDDAYALRIALPDRGTQRRIAARLKAQLAEVETARRAAQAQLADADALRLAIYREAFVDGALYESVEIRDVAPVQSGYAFKSTAFRSCGIRLLRNTNILPGRVYWDDTAHFDPEEALEYGAYRLDEGDVLLSLDRPLIAQGIKVARVSALDAPSLLVQRVGRFHVDESRLDKGFLFGFLNSPMFIAAISGHEQSLGVPHISPGQVGAVRIPLPALRQQREIARALQDRLASAHELRAAAQSRLADLDALPARLLAAAFNPSTQGAAP